MRELLHRHGQGLPQIGGGAARGGRDIFPPRYLDHRPEDLWFWLEFGQDHARARDIWIKRYQLVRAAEAQNWRCCYCGDRADIPPDGVARPWDATREHVVPRSEGGGEDDGNIAMACSRCNNERGVQDAYRYQPIAVRRFLARG